MTVYEIMRTINNLINKDIKELNKQDCSYIFGASSHNDFQKLRGELEYVGCNVVAVADLFNVTLPDEKFSRKELTTQREFAQFAKKYFN